MHRAWQIPELLVHIISFLPAASITRAFHISHHFQTILKANLPPPLRPLPDACIYPDLSLNKRPPTPHTLSQDVRANAAAYIALELDTPIQLKVEDVYYYWCEAARTQVLESLLPYLHDVFAKFETRMVDGYESLAKGKLDVALQIDVPYHALYELVHGERRDYCDGYLMGKLVSAVTVFCLGGAQWDLLYAGVRYRDYGGVKRFSIRLEREEGVRLSDVMEELAGTLLVGGMSGGLGQDVTLIWRFEGSSSTKT